MNNPNETNPPAAHEHRTGGVSAETGLLSGSRRYSMTLDDGSEASFIYCGEGPPSAEFARAMKAVMEAAAESVRRDGLPDNAPISATEARP